MRDRTDPAKLVRTAIEQGDLARTVGKLRQRKPQARALTDEEIAQLQANGCGATDWADVRVRDGFTTQRVRRCFFAGPVEMGRFERRIDVGTGCNIGAGIFNCDLRDVILEDDCLILNVTWLANYVIGHGAAVVNCGEMVAEPGTRFGLGGEIEIGPETGGREIRIFAEMTLDAAAALVLSRAQPETLRRYDEALDDYLAAIESPRGILGEAAIVRHTPRVLNACIGQNARVCNATAIENAVLLSNVEEPARIGDGAIVKNSVVQWGARVDTRALVEDSLLCEYAHAGRQAKVCGCVVGPNSGVESGEAIASLIGPFVGFHHQALLIGTVWPEGKGNVGYGANVGSNHTGRAPDQELHAGEGVFFGLGTNIKFPADLSRAPYTIIATGVTALPQRVEMPFSLIVSPMNHYPDVPPAYNEIVPAWVLAECLYLIWRNELKFAARNQARRHDIPVDAFRPETIDLMLAARRQLQSVSGRDTYTHRELSGLGRNVMTEASRAKAIDTYTFFIRYYALMAFWQNLRASLDEGGEESEHSPRWHHAAPILGREFEEREPQQLLDELSKAADAVAAQVEASKARDDQRGPGIIHDYADAHRPASENEVVRDVRGWTTALQEQIAAARQRV